MKIRFLIMYRTTWGENLRVVMRYGSKHPKVQEVDLETTDGQCWNAEVELPIRTRCVEYFYRVCCGGETLREEWHAAGIRQLILSADTRSYICCDQWKDIPQDAYLYSSAFTKSFTRHGKSNEKLTFYNRTMIIRTEAPQLRRNEVLAVSGNQDVWGNWDTSKALRMTEISPNVWVSTVDVEQLTGSADFKFVALNGESGEERAWECCDNRHLSVPYLQQGEACMVTMEPVVLPYPQWRGAGCVIPVFSLRTEGSFGVGDFGDLKQMIDWIAQTGQRVLQILPINDTTISHEWTDSYPYNSTSIYAFHPQYVDLRQLPKLKDKKMRDEYETKRRELNALPQVDYKAVNDTKRAYLRQLFTEQGEKTKKSAGYKKFFMENEEWLRPFAVFSYLRDKNHTANFRSWKQLATYDKEEVNALFVEGDKEAQFETGLHCYIQYLLHIQLLDVGEYARSKGVVIKGDIPIGISRDSMEAWMEPHYFNMNGQAGAPPDAFSTNGQNWGFPTYDWKTMQADGCRWWIRRFRKMAEYFDAYRIDHVLGFFRIWEIPLHSVHGLLGHFSPALPLAIEEIENYGLQFRKRLYTKPYIKDWVLDKEFGIMADEVKRTYLDDAGDGHYQMKPEFETQRKVQSHFCGRSNETDIQLRDKLYALISDVLFIQDEQQPNSYHPRINVQNDNVFQALNPNEQEAFNRLYNDYYYRRHDQFWYNEAMKKLPVLTSATRMLVCAEDLGMVPTCVPWVMNDLRILTLEIQSMSKNPNYEFGHLNENPYRSVATISTHDMATLRGWWDEDEERTQRYYNYMLEKPGTAPHPMPAYLCEEVVVRHLNSPSMLCLLSFQDWTSIDENIRYSDTGFERINVPANPFNYWRYRMHISIEDLKKNTNLNNKIVQLIEQSGRTTSN